MTTEDIGKLKAESATTILKLAIENVVKTEEHVLFLKKQLELLSKKSKLSEDEKKQKVEHETNIKRLTLGVEDNRLHVEILRSLIETYTKNESVTL